MLAAMADELVTPDTTAPRVAAFDAPLIDPNLEDARIAHTFAPLAGVPVLGLVESAYRQRFRLKSWQYMTASTDYHGARTAALSAAAALYGLGGTEYAAVNAAYAAIGVN